MKAAESAQLRLMWQAVACALEMRDERCTCELIGRQIYTSQSLQEQVDEDRDDVLSSPFTGMRVLDLTLQVYELHLLLEGGSSSLPT